MPSQRCMASEEWHEHKVIVQKTRSIEIADQGFFLGQNRTSWLVMVIKGLVIKSGFDKRKGLLDQTRASGDCTIITPDYNGSLDRWLYWKKRS